MSESRFTKFVIELQKSNPEFNIKFKDESGFMKLLGTLLFFNKGFMSEFITTIGNTVYFPSADYLKQHSDSSNIAVTSHEFVHSTDGNKYGHLIFSFFYLFPLSIAPFMLLLLPVNIILSLILLALCLLPLPAFWRRNFELRGYTMSLFVYNEIAKENNAPESQRQFMLQKAALEFNKNFTGSAYYFMWPFGVKKQLMQAVEDILSGHIFSKDKIYSQISDKLKATK